VPSSPEDWDDPIPEGNPRAADWTRETVLIRSGGPGGEEEEVEEVPS